MLDALEFVSGAVAKRGIVPEMLHFQIKNGRIGSYNGVVALSSPIALNLDVCPKAEQMLKAIYACEAPRITMHVTDSGKLSIKSGTFRVLVDCFTWAPITSPDFTGWIGHKIEEPLLPILSLLLPFISEDASRKWSQGIILKNGKLYATNNITLIAHDTLIASDLSFILPKAAILELLRIGEEPESLFIADNCVVFNYSGGRWLKTQLIHWEGVPNISGMLEGVIDLKDRFTPITFLSNLEKLQPFADTFKRVFIQGEEITAGDASFITSDIHCNQKVIFNIDTLIKVARVASGIALDAYPSACPFFGNRIQGIIAGMRD